MAAPINLGELRTHLIAELQPNSRTVQNRWEDAEDLFAQNSLLDSMDQPAAQQVGELLLRHLRTRLRLPLGGRLRSDRLEEIKSELEHMVAFTTRELR